MYTSPYKKYEATLVWKCLNHSIEALILNGDLEEKTKRENIIGYIIYSLNKEKLIASLK